MLEHEQYLAAGNRAVGWAAARVGANGHFQGDAHCLFAYYKAPIAFATAGRVAEAASVMRTIERDFFRGGTFVEEVPYPAATASPEYRRAWLTFGAHAVRAYALSYPACDRLSEQIHPRLGGIVVEGASGTGGGRQVDWGTTCCAIVAFLSRGRVKDAVRAGNFILQLISDQPNPTRRLCMRRDDTGNLVGSEDPEKAVGWVIEYSKTGQIYWYLGFALVAFAQLLSATGDIVWQEGAEKVYSFIERCNAEVYESITNGKIAWGSALMFAATGEERYCALAARVGRWLVEIQTPEGPWVRRPRYATLAEQPLAVSLDTTLERGFFMLELARVFAGRAG
ncbi:MAG: hypothetical protein WB783_11740 [Arenicellales bacterium]